MSDWQLSSLAQICNFSLRLLLTMEILYIYENLDSPSDWKDDIENTEWLDLLLPFTTVKNLYLCKGLATRIAPALQELTGGKTTDVLPALKNVLLEGFHVSEHVQEGIAHLISARQLINHIIAVSLGQGHDRLWEKIDKRTPLIILRLVFRTVYLPVNSQYFIT